MRQLLGTVWFLAWALTLPLGQAWGEGRQKGARDGQPEGVNSAPPLVMRGVHLEEFEEEGRTTELWAGLAHYSKDNGLLRLANVRILASAKEGDHSKPFELTGERGTYEIKTQTARVEGKVRIRSQEGYLLSTESVTYDEGKREIEGTDAVLLEGPEGKTAGVGLHVWINEEKVILRQAVRTLIEPTALQRAKEVLR